MYDNKIPLNFSGSSHDTLSWVELTFEALTLRGSLGTVEKEYCHDKLVVLLTVFKTKNTVGAQIETILLINALF